MTTRFIAASCYILVMLSGATLTIFTVLSQSLRRKVRTKEISKDVSNIDCIMYKATMLGFMINGESMAVGLMGFFATVLRFRQVENVVCGLSFLLANVYILMTVAITRTDPLVPKLLERNFLLDDVNVEVVQKCLELVPWPVDSVVVVVLLLCYLRVFQSICCLLYLRNSSLLPYYFATDN
ncbi:hypothetical protein BOX15_Mlig032373g3 [Macrostomum lignano]|uniref:Uncharacterized protein n=1 Tax=Macrostomum lignano TaxID=282301 RepID=A0A267DT00_9PLAT|nr:hypothetical protein BOX15_Mlig032373g3 [Macrostomum lignano]